MADTKKQKKEVNPIATGVTGALIGAGVTAVAALALKDKKTQQKVKNTFNSVKDRTKGYIGKVKTRITAQQEIVDKKLDDGKKQVAQAVNSVKPAEKKSSGK